MNWQGWIFMILSWTVIVGLFTFCLRRTLRPATKKENEPEQQSES